MFGLLDIPKLVAAMALGMVVAGVPAYFQGKAHQRQAMAVEAMAKQIQSYKDRNDENASVEALDPVGLCIDLGGVPDDCRTELRRMGEDQP